MADQIRCRAADAEHGFRGDREAFRSHSRDHPALAAGAAAADAQAQISIADQSLGLARAQTD
jgi:hypothetical protein